MKDVSRREFLKTLCLGITVAALQNLPMTTAFADSAISKTKIISKSDRENLVATVARTVQVSYKIDKNTIIEVTRFTDIDGQNVTLNRSVKEDGTGELVYTKAQKTKKSKLTNQSYDFYDVGTYLDCSVGCYFGVVGSSKPIYWSATTQVTIPKL